MIVADFMTRQVITVAPDSPVLAAAKLMLEYKVSGLPVVDTAGHLVGIVSEHDLLRRRDGGMQRPHWLQLMTERPGLASEQSQFQERKVSEVMTPDPLTVAATASLEVACRLIEDRGIKRLPVIQDDRLVGIIARADLVRALAKTMQSAAPVSTPDVSVDERLRELERQIWHSHARVRKPF